MFFFYISGDFGTDDDGLFKCNCMPACTEISYNVETSQAEFSWQQHVKERDLNDTTLAVEK